MMRAFLRPVPQGVVPALDRRVQATSRQVVVLSVLIGVAVRSVEAIGGAVPFEVLIPYQLIVLASYGLVGLFALRPVGRRNPEWTIVGIGLVASAEVSASGILYPGGNPLLPYVACVSMVLVLLAPFRARTILAVVGIGMVTTFVAGHWSLDLPRYELQIRVALVAVMGVLAAGASHAQRLVWLDADRAAARARLVAKDRLIQTGRLGAAMAHELKTPLAIAQNQIATADDLIDELQASFGHPDVTDGDLREVTSELQEALIIARAAADRTVRVVRSMRESSQSVSQGQPIRFELRARVELVLLMLKPLLGSGHVAVDVDGDEAHAVGEPIIFDQVLVNLVRNAVDAMNATGIGSRVSIVVRRIGQRVLISVEDDGPGVPASIRDR